MDHLFAGLKNNLIHLLLNRSNRISILKYVNMKNKFFSKSIFISVFMLGISLSVKSAGTSPNIKEETVSYSANGVTYKGFIAYDENIKGKRPAILVVPEWWGLNDYPKMRARKLAELGYIAMATDVFGDGKVAAESN